MKLRVLAISAVVDGWEEVAQITSEPWASRDGKPVLVVEGEPVGPEEAWLAGYEILEADKEECDALARGGYRLENAPA